MKKKNLEFGQYNLMKYLIILTILTCVLSNSKISEVWSNTPEDLRCSWPEVYDIGTLKFRAPRFKYRALTPTPGQTLRLWNVKENMPVSSPSSIFIRARLTTHFYQGSSGGKETSARARENVRVYASAEDLAKFQAQLYVYYRGCFELEKFRALLHLPIMGQKNSEFSYIIEAF